MCVCVREREKETESVCVGDRERECVSEKEGERERRQRFTTFESASQKPLVTNFVALKACFSLLSRLVHNFFNEFLHS